MRVRLLSVSGSARPVGRDKLNQWARRSASLLRLGLGGLAS